MPMTFRPGAAKSERVELIEVDDRVSARKPSKWGAPAPSSAVRSRPTWSSSPAWGEVKPNLSRNGQGTEAGPEFTRPKVVPAGLLTGVSSPAALVTVQR